MLLLTWTFLIRLSLAVGVVVVIVEVVLMRLNFGNVLSLSSSAQAYNWVVIQLLSVDELLFAFDRWGLAVATNYSFLIVLADQRHFYPLLFVQKQVLL